jgi:hypothetical protein
MSQPTPKQLAIHKSLPGNSFASVKVVDPIAGCQCIKGDIVPHPQGGWHVCLVPAAAYPGSGIPAGSSNDQFHWSLGASSTSAGVSQPSGANWDQVSSGVGSDGRASLDGTFGGATGAASGGVSNQSSGAGNSGGGGGSPTRGF